MTLLNETAMPYYTARAELIVLFIIFMRQASKQALSANLLRKLLYIFAILILAELLTLSLTTVY